MANRDFSTENSNHSPSRPRGGRSDETRDLGSRGYEEGYSEGGYGPEHFGRQHGNPDSRSAGHSSAGYSAAPPRTGRGALARSRGEDRRGTEFGHRGSTSSLPRNYDDGRSERAVDARGRPGSAGSPTSRGDHAGKGPKGWVRNDARIAEAVNEALWHHPEIDASEIEVSVEQGTVTLSGSVDSRPIKRAAEHAVENLVGVVDVRNALKLARPALRGFDTTGDSATPRPRDRDS